MTVREISISLAFGACLLTAACGSSGTVQSASARPAPPAFIEAACGGCHAVQPPFLSPNPESPSFEAIANREGLTGDTLRAWLTDAHNYPEVMDFDLEPKHIKQVAEYMETLRREDYVPEQ